MKLFLALSAILMAQHAQASIQAFPEYRCEQASVEIQLVDLKLCTNKNALRSVNVLGLSDPNLVLTLSKQELAIAKLPPAIAIANLHQKMGITVHQLFMRLASGELTPEITAAFAVNEQNPIQVFQHEALFALAVIGSNQDYDRIYLNLKDGEAIYQITGEFNQLELESILAAIQYID
ncbi:hypothetical protein ACFOEE_11585 [Pseudoalteromonas fenneropenaei]|uniref:DUF4154 domain-containing protein n=1 Tax=Pseudoalteromonas fenneropenaei TaxID=1737459 RepID=A0ABV7CKJ8_9GAMM